jgi:hypothetical protein
MANTFTVENQTVPGSCRMLIGTLTASDSSTGSVAGTGMNNIWCVLGEGSTSTKYTHSASGVMMCTASSGGTATVLIFGT